MKKEKRATEIDKAIDVLLKSGADEESIIWQRWDNKRAEQKIVRASIKSRNGKPFRL